MCHGDHKEEESIIPHVADEEATIMSTTGRSDQMNSEDTGVDRESNSSGSGSGSETKNTAAAMLHAGLSIEEVDKALVAELRFDSDKKNKNQDEIEIKFHDSQTFPDESAQLFTEHGPGSVHSSLADYPLMGGDRDSSRYSSHSSSSFATDSRSYRIESSRQDDSDHTRPVAQSPDSSSGSERRPEPIISKPGAVHAKNYPRAKIITSDTTDSEWRRPRPGAVHAKSHPNAKISTKEEILNEMANFEVALRLEKQEKQIAAGTYDAPDTVIRSDRQRSTPGSFRASLPETSRAEKSSLDRRKKASSKMTAQDLHSRLAHSRPSLRGADRWSSRRLIERANSRRSVLERSSSRRGFSERDSLHKDNLDTEPLPSWTLNARPRNSVRVSPPEGDPNPNSSARCNPSAPEFYEQRRRNLEFHEPAQRRHSPPDISHEQRRRSIPPEHYEPRRQRHSPPSSQYADRRGEYRGGREEDEYRRRSSSQEYDYRGRHSPPDSVDPYYGDSSPPYHEYRRDRNNPPYHSDYRGRNLPQYDYQGRNSPPYYEHRGRQNPPPDHYGRHEEHHHHHRDRRSPHTPPRKPVEIEISPNAWMELRGADETWKAVQVGAYLPTMCLSCDLNILVILDAEFVLCPSCRVVSPIMDDGSGVREEASSATHGVGLGFKVEDLMRWQDEMARGVDPRDGFS